MSEVFRAPYAVSARSGDGQTPWRRTNGLAERGLGTGVSSTLSLDTMINRLLDNIAEKLT